MPTLLYHRWGMVYVTQGTQREPLYEEGKKGIENDASGGVVTLRGRDTGEDELAVGRGQVRKVDVLTACLLHSQVYTRDSRKSIRTE